MRQLPFSLLAHPALNMPVCPTEGIVGSVPPETVELFGLPVLILPPDCVVGFRSAGDDAGLMVLISALASFAPPILDEVAADFAEDLPELPPEDLPPEPPEPPPEPFSFSSLR